MKRTELTKVAELVAKHFNISQADLVKPTRKMEYIRARHFFFYFAYKCSTICYDKIGAFCRDALGRDKAFTHASVWHAKHKIEQHIIDYKDYENDYMEIMKLLKPFIEGSKIIVEQEKHVIIENYENKINELQSKIESLRDIITYYSKTHGLKSITDDLNDIELEILKERCIPIVKMIKSRRTHISELKEKINK